MFLPPEIVEHILSVIPYDAQTVSSLLPLALVCRTWTPLVEARLYRHILVHRKGQWRKLRQALQVRPYLRGLTRSLEFTGVHVELGSKSHQFGQLFPMLERVSFCKESMSVPVLGQLAMGGPGTLRDVALVGTRANWTSICEFFRTTSFPWKSIELELPPFGRSGPRGSSVLYSLLLAFSLAGRLGSWTYFRSPTRADRVFPF